MSRMQRQALALGMIVLGSAALYWVESSTLIWGLMAMIGLGMLLSISGEGGQ